MRRAHADGFTLIEILIVITILGVLMAVLLPNVLGGWEGAQRSETEGRLTLLRTEIEAFERQDKHSWYPPDNFKSPDPDFKVLAKEDGVNSGIESLVIFLSQKQRSPFSDKAEWLANTDQDKNSGDIPGLSTIEKREVVDAWGTPIAYFVSWTKGYEREQLVQPSEGEVQKVRAVKYPKSGKPLNEGRYQLISAGPDMTFGTDDDITWPKRD